MITDNPTTGRCAPLDCSWHSGGACNLKQSTVALCLVLYIAITAVCGLYYCSIPPSPDQSAFDYMAWQGLQGVPWYTGSFDTTWPGPLVIHELGIRLFGVHRWTARLADFLLLQPAIFGIYLFLKSAGLRWAAIVAALVYPIIYVTSSGWMAGHRDIVAMHFLIGAAAVIVAGARHQKLRLALAGMLIGYAVMLRPTYLAFAPFAFAASLAISPDRMRLGDVMARAIALGLGTLAFPVLFAIAGVLNGNIADWFDQSVRFVLSVYQVEASRARLVTRFWELIKEFMLWLAIAGSLGLIFWFSRRVRTYGFVLLGLISTVLISFIAQNKGFGYHLGGLIPLFVISASGASELGIQAALQRPGRWRVVWLATPALVLLVLVAGTARRVQHYVMPHYMRVAHAGLGALVAVRHDLTAAETARVEMVDIIRQESEPGDRFFQWGWKFDVAFRSQRLAASRYVHTPLLALIRAGDPHYENWSNVFDQDLSASRPVFVLLDLRTLPEGAHADELPITLPDAASPALVRLVGHLNRSYTIRRQWDDTLLLKYTTRMGASSQSHSQGAGTTQ